MNVVLSGTSVDFEPSARGFEVVVLSVFDKMLEAVGTVPRVETKLYPSEAGHTARPNLRPVIAAKLVERAKAQVQCTNWSSGVWRVHV